MGQRLSPFDAEVGTTQGRLTPAGWPTPPDGTHALVLGSDVVGRRYSLVAGDYVEASQTADFVATLVRFATRIRPPADAQAGISWALSLLVDEVAKLTVPFAPGDAQRTRYDLAALTPGLTSGSHRVTFRLTLSAAPTSPCEVELPGVYIDRVLQDTATTRLRLINRSPEPNETERPRTSPIELTIVDTGANGVDLSATSVRIDGVAAFLGGAVQPGFAGGATATAGGYTLSLTPSSPLGSDANVVVRVISSTVGGAAQLDETYQFRTVDQTSPTVVEAVGTGASRVMVRFSEPVLEVDAGSLASALRPENYTVRLLAGAPAVTPTVVSVLAATDRSVTLVLDMPITPRATYQLIVLGVEDLHGNPIDIPGNTMTFLGFAPPRPADRDFDIYSFFPEKNHLEDDTGDLRMLTRCWQEVTDLLLSQVDVFAERVLDPDFCDAEQLDIMLADLGNPFPFAASLDELGKRRLVQTLAAIYGLKGTDPGIIKAINFFMGLTVSVTHPQMGGVPLGKAIIGSSGTDAWILGASSLREKMTFYVNFSTLLTDDQLVQARAIMRYMARAATHPVIRQPAPPPAAPDHLVLGLSRLGITWRLH